MEIITDATAIQAMFETMFGCAPLGVRLPETLPSRSINFKADAICGPAECWDRWLQPVWSTLSAAVANDRCGVSMYGANWTFTELAPCEYDIAVCTEPDQFKVMSALAAADQPEFSEVADARIPLHSGPKGLAYIPGLPCHNLAAWRDSGLPIPPHRYMPESDMFVWVSQEMVDEMSAACTAAAMFRKAMISAQSACDAVSRGEVRPWPMSRAIDEAAAIRAPKNTPD